jgi:WD40 repeat protein
MRDSKSYFEKKRKKTNKYGGVGGVGGGSKFKSNPLVPDWPCKNCGTMVSSGVAGSISGCLKCGINCIRYTFEQHQCGVTDFAWSESNRMMISVGVERGPLVWNPFSKSTVTQLDAGHASIMAVTVDERRQRIISVDAANHIHVHSFKNYKALQNLHQRTEHDHGIDSGSSSSDVGGASSSNAPSSSVVDTSGDACRLADVLRIGAMFFQDSNTVGGSLITATTHLHKWKLSADITRGNRGPDAERSPIGCCLYNSSFHQVATAELDDQSSICIWDPSTGNIIARLANAHEGSAVTAMTFDSGERRLITGSHDGCELHVFNFGNRRLLSRLVKLPSDVVTSALGSIEDKIVGRQISLVGDSKYDEMTELTVAMNSTFDVINNSSRIDLVPSPSLQPSPKQKKARTHQPSIIQQQSINNRL